MPSKCILTEDSLCIQNTTKRWKGHGVILLSITSVVVSCLLLTTVLLQRLHRRNAACSRWPGIAGCHFYEKRFEHNDMPSLPPPVAALSLSRLLFLLFFSLLNYHIPLLYSHLLVLPLPLPLPFCFTHLFPLQQSLSLFSPLLLFFFLSTPLLLLFSPALLSS